MKVNAVKQRGIFRCRIDLAEAFETGTPEREEWGDGYVVLREATGSEFQELYAGDATQNAQKLSAKIHEFIVDHNFETDEDKPASAKDVASLINSSSSVLMYVLEKYQKSLPLVRRNARESEKQQGPFLATAE